MRKDKDAMRLYKSETQADAIGICVRGIYAGLFEKHLREKEFQSGDLRENGRARSRIAVGTRSQWFLTLCFCCANGYQSGKKVPAPIQNSARDLRFFL